MALIKCPECGKENVSDTATACPGCGYNIQEHTILVNQEIQRAAAEEASRLRAKEQEERRIARKNDPVYQKKKWTIISLAVLAVVVCIVLIAVGSKLKEDNSFEKDLSSVFNISLDASIEDIIEFEASEFGHTEYGQEYIQDGKKIRLDFGPYVTADGETEYKHRYFFYTDGEKLDSINYMAILGSWADDEEALKCEHVHEIRLRALRISSEWDLNENDGLFLTMNGQINGTRCRVRYQSGAGEGICLFIDSEVE